MCYYLFLVLSRPSLSFFFFFFFNDTATTEIYTLSLHDALPIYGGNGELDGLGLVFCIVHGMTNILRTCSARSEEHTSELQSRLHLVCRLLLEKKKTMMSTTMSSSYDHICHTSITSFRVDSHQCS